MKTTIDYHTGNRPDGTRCTALVDVVTDESRYPDAETAADVHAASIELLSLDRQDRVSAKELLEKEEFDPENEASVIRRCIAEAAGKAKMERCHMCKAELAHECGVCGLSGMAIPATHELHYPGAAPEEPDYARFVCEDCLEDVPLHEFDPYRKEDYVRL